MSSQRRSIPRPDRVPPQGVFRPQCPAQGPGAHAFAARYFGRPKLRPEKSPRRRTDCSERSQWGLSSSRVCSPKLARNDTARKPSRLPCVVQVSRGPIPQSARCHHLLASYKRRCAASEHAGYGDRRCRTWVVDWRTYRRGRAGRAPGRKRAISTHSVCFAAIPRRPMRPLRHSAALPTASPG
jgi:hypothetical protein